MYLPIFYLNTSGIKEIINNFQFYKIKIKSTIHGTVNMYRYYIEGIIKNPSHAPNNRKQRSIE